MRHPETKSLHVNFDRKILEVMREIEVLTKMGLDLPTQARPFAAQEKQMKRKLDIISVSDLFRAEFACAGRLYLMSLQSGSSGLAVCA